MSALTDLKAYLETTLEGDYSDAVLSNVIEVEIADQANRVRAAYRLTILDDWNDHPAPLREAITRRCARTLALRKIPLGIVEGEAGATHVYGKDTEVRRLESPYLRLSVG